MKHLFILFSILFIGSSFLWEATAAEKKRALKVLYVGQDPNVPLKKYHMINSGAIAKERYADDIRTRMPEFKALLERYFQQVTCIDADAYTAEQSDAYDVTIFDALPPSQTSTLGPRVKSYLPENFDKPVVFIGHTAPLMGESLGLKTDWYCMCLKEHALQIKTDHAIFKGPFSTPITLKERPVSTTVYNYPNGSNVPMKLPMWRVQKEHIKGYRIGMVAHGDAFEDSPDAEVISGGECLKSIDAVAIGRHGNFLMWGFAASPSHMTEEAQRVFINTICYIHQFEGQKPLARKIVKGMTVRDRIRDNLLVLEEKTYNAYCQRMNKMGRPPLTETQFLKEQLHKDLYQQFGNDKEACKRFLNENMNFFYGKNYSFVVDKDVKSIGIANSDKKLLDTCIRMWEEGKEIEKAKRILQRYTVYNFATPQEWRNWYYTYESKLFFTESGGYLFRINDKHVEQPLTASQETPTEKKQSEANSSKQEPTQEKPVVFTASLKKDISGKGEVRLQGHILEGFHIYASGEEDCPFYLTEVEFIFPEGYKATSTINSTPSTSMAGADKIQVYKGHVMFSQKYEGHSFHMNPILRCKVTYQCCNNDICLPPVTDEFELILQ